MSLFSRHAATCALLLSATLCAGSLTAQAAPKKKKPVRPSLTNATQPHTGDVMILGEEPAPSTRPRGAKSYAAPKAKRWPAAKQKTPSYQPAAAPPANYPLNNQLVRFCRANMGRKVGNGQCTELVVLGLPAIGAQPGVNYEWGSFVCQLNAGGGRQTIEIGPAGRLGNSRIQANIQPGDVLQFEGVNFERRWATGYSTKSAPHHTAVVSWVSRDGRTLQVLEQNVNGVQLVQENTVYLADMTTGTIRITRPMPRY